MMDKMVAKFPEQLREAVQLAQQISINYDPERIQQVMVTGMGGSGIGANFVAEFVKSTCPVPYLINKGYELPAYVNENTLLVASSYSGNTEETITAFTDGLSRGAMGVVVSSNGALKTLAEAENLPFIALPTGWASPRACLGFSLVQQLGILIKLGLISDNYLTQIEAAAALLDKESEDIHKRANFLADMLVDSTPIIYTTDRMESVAVRFRQQINENANMLCWHHVIPEMNHNELVGWYEHREDAAVIFLRNRDDLPRNQARIEIIKDIMRPLAPTMVDIFSKGQSLVERSLYLVHLCDWTSVYLAEKRNIDAVSIAPIDELKAALSKLEG